MKKVALLSILSILLLSSSTPSLAMRWLAILFWSKPKQQASSTQSTQPTTSSTPANTLNENHDE